MLALLSLAPGPAGRALDRRDLGRPSFGSNGFRARLGGVVGVAQPLYSGSALAADAGVREDAPGELLQRRRPIRIMYLEVLSTLASARLSLTVDLWPRC